MNCLIQKKYDIFMGIVLVVFVAGFFVNFLKQVLRSEQEQGKVIRTLTTESPDENTEENKLSPIEKEQNFYLFPWQEIPYSNQPCEFFCQTTSLDFLTEIHVDFNMCIREGKSLTHSFVLLDNLLRSYTCVGFRESELRKKEDGSKKKTTTTGHMRYIYNVPRRFLANFRGGFKC
uniref:Uncharacterized protein n=1 Tax=Solanum lycopersicum TaxID=4081 RepID=A0A3Q7IER7_SOLLC